MAGSRRRSIGISVAMIGMIGVCGWFVVMRNALAPLLCFYTGDQAAMVETFKDDPLLSATPEDGRLREERATTYDCDNGRGGSPTTPQFAQLTRSYTVPAVYDVAQLRERFAQAAAAAGWVAYEERSDGEGQTSFFYVRYCRSFGERVADAWIRSRSGPLGPVLEVEFDARRAAGSLCS